MHSLILHVISKSHPLWQAHAQSHLTRHIKIPPPLASTCRSHLTRHIKIPPPLASTCTVSSYTSYQNPTPSGKYMHSHISHYTIKIPPPLASTYKVTFYGSYEHPLPLWQVHAQSHLTRHIKIPPPLASTCTVTLHYTIKIPPPVASTYKVTSSGSYENPTPSGRYMHSLILHVISKSHRLWQVHAQSHLTRQIKIPPPLASTCAVSSYTSYQNPTPLASTCKVTSYTSYQNPTPSGKYMHSLILHVISKSHPLWQVHARSHLTRHIKIPPPLASTCRSHLTRHIKIPPPLASTCTVSSYTSYQNPTPSGKYMHSHITQSKSHPLWQAHTKSHLPVHMKIPPPLAGTCTVSSYTSYQNPTASGKYMHSLILHVKSRSHSLWQVHAQSHLTRHIKIPPQLGVHAKSHLTRHIKIPPPLVSTCTVSSYTSNQNPTPSGKYMQSHILHVISKSHPLWQVHAQSHLTRHIKIPPPLASNYMHSLILHVISKSHPLWQVHAQSHLTRHIKIPPPLASTCTVSSYTSYQNPTPSGKHMHNLILHVISKSHLLWQVHAQSHLTRHIKIPPPLASTCTVSSYTFTDLGLRNIVYEPWFTSHGLRSIVYEPWFTKAEVNPSIGDR